MQRDRFSGALNGQVTFNVELIITFGDNFGAAESRRRVFRYVKIFRALKLFGQQRYVAVYFRNRKGNINS